MDYTGDEALYPGASFEEDGGDYRVELDALDLSQTDEEEGEKSPRDLLEARFAAGRIQTLLEEGFQVVDQNGGLPAGVCGGYRHSSALAGGGASPLCQGAGRTGYSLGGGWGRGFSGLH